MASEFDALVKDFPRYLASMRGAVKLRSAAVLLAALTGGTALGLIAALMAIPAAAGATVLLPERLQARNAADSDTAG